MHDAMFAHRTDLSRSAILSLARSSGLDMKRFQADLDSPETKKTVARDMEDGDRAGVEGTPSVYINGRKYNGALIYRRSGRSSTRNCKRRSKPPRRPQKANLAANCKIRGSPALWILPNVDEFRDETGKFRFVWLSRLKNSKRSSKRWCSRTGK